MNGGSSLPITKNADCRKQFGDAIRDEKATHIILDFKKTAMGKKEVLERLHKQMIAEIIDYAIILIDIDGTILSWNAGAEKIKGYKEEEIVGQNFRLFYLPEDRQAGLPEQLIEIAKKEGRAKQIGRRVRKDGSTFWGSILITALHDEDGNVIGFTKLTKELDS